MTAATTTDQAPLAKALAIIEARAAKAGPFSANDLREEMDTAGITGPVVGRAFAKANADGVIKRVSLLGIVSTQKRTHRKRIDEWTGA